MSLESDIDILSGVALFSDLTRDQLRLLAFGAEHRSLREGEFLYRAEARADAGFVIVSGQVELVVEGKRGRRVLAEAGPGTLLGELALITETRRGANAVTASPCDVIRIARPLFRRMLQEFPEIAAGLRARIAADLADMTQSVVALEGRFQD
jgi:CRP-like cAMP-binding protein